MNDQTQKRSREEMRHEYSELNQNFRHYSGLRFAIFTVFFAIIGGLASVAFGASQPVAGLSGIAKVGGLVVTVAFFMLEMILQRYLDHFMEVGRKLEKSLGYTQLSTRPSSPVLKTVYATWGLFILVLGFWMYAIFYLK